MKLILLVISLILLHGKGWSAELAEERVLPLKTCIDKTLENHPDIRQLLYAVEQKKAALAAGRGVNLPQVFAVAEYDPLKTFVMPQNGNFETTEEASWRAGITITQKLYDFGTSRGRIEASKHAEDIARLSLVEAKMLLIFQVQTLYDSLLLHKAAIRAREEDLKTRQALYNQARELRISGLKTRADEARFLASLYSAEEALLEARASFLRAKNLMELYMGESIEADSAYENLLEERSLIALDGEKAKALKARLLTKNKKMELQKQMISRSEALLKSAKGERFGSIDASASYFRESNLSDYDVSKAGVSLQVPIFTGGILKAREDEAKAVVDEARNAYASQKLELIKVYDEAIIDLGLSEASMRARKAKIEAAGEASDLIIARYGEGLATSIEVLDAEAQRLDAKLGLLQARYNKSATLYYIDYLTSKEEKLL